MSRAEVDRVREDLATMKKAAGVELPFGREDVWLNLGVGVGGIVAAIWTILPHGLPHNWGLIPLLILAVVYVVQLRIKYRRRTGRSPIRRREYSASLILAVVLGALALVYRLWGSKLGLSPSHLQGLAIFFVGLALLVPAVLDRGRAYFAGLALPCVLCGLAIPLLPVRVVALFGAACAIGGASMAAIQVYQLRAQGREPAHGAD